MRRIFVFLFGLILLSALLFSCSGKGKGGKDGAKRQAVIQLDSTSAWLGTFPKSQSVRSTVFTFTNVGDANLEFLDMDVSCGCVSAVLPEKPIKPGKKGEIIVTFRGKNKKPGKVYQKVYVEVNCDPPTFVLRVSGQMTEN